MLTVARMLKSLVSSFSGLHKNIKLLSDCQKLESKDADFIISTTCN